MKLGEVAAVEPVEDINYKVYNYYDNIIADFIFRLNGALEKEDTNALHIVDLLNQGQALYLCYGSGNGGSYNNSYPVSRGYLCVIIGNNSNIIATATATSSDYMSVTGFTQYASNSAHSTYRFTSNGVLELQGDFPTGQQTIYFPLQLFNRKSDLFSEYMNAYNNGNEEKIAQLLEDIKTEQQDMNDYLQSNDTSEVDTSLPTESVEDPTEALWSDLFTSIRTAATSNTPQYISIKIPFINYSFTFSPVESSPMTQLKGKMKPLYDLIIASWWFGASLWIIRDIHKYLEDIKNGDITSRDNNIKTEVL